MFLIQPRAFPTLSYPTIFLPHQRFSHISLHCLQHTTFFPVSGSSPLLFPFVFFFFFFKILFFPFSPQSPPVHSCIFFVGGPSSCGMWDAASAWFDEQCHVHAQDLNQRNTGPPAAERANSTTQPRGQPPFCLIYTLLSLSQNTTSNHVRLREACLTPLH